jgi:hypothetical protein
MGRSTGLSLLAQFPSTRHGLASGNAVQIQSAENALQEDGEEEPKCVSFLTLIRQCMVISSNYSTGNLHLSIKFIVRFQL